MFTTIYHNSNENKLGVHTYIRRPRTEKRGKWERREDEARRLFGLGVFFVG